MALLPQEPAKQVALLVIIAALGALYAFHGFWYTPQTEEIASLESRLSTLETRNRQAQVVAARGGPELDETLAVYERHVERLEALIPNAEEVPALMNSLTLEAQRAGVDLTGLNPEVPEPGALYTLQTYGVSVVGEYHDVGEFLAAIASLPRIVTPVDLEMRMFTGGAVRQEMESPVVADFRVQTYVLGAGEPGDVGGNEGA